MDPQSSSAGASEHQHKEEEDVNLSTVHEDIKDAALHEEVSLYQELEAVRTQLPASFRKRLATHGERLASKLETRMNAIRTNMKRAPFVKTRDKFSFVLGVTNVALTFFLMGGLPEWVPLYFTLKAVLLIGIRWFTFKGKKWHYFLFDFCYYANALILVYLHVFPKSESLFLICFAFSSGPLAWSVLAWGNSLVFHSLEKITSLFIHLTPNLLFYTMRWLIKDPESIAKYASFQDRLPSVMEVFLLAIPPYLLWQFLYYIKVQVISAKKVEERDYLTSFRWFIHSKNSSIGKLIQSAGPHWQLAAFMAYQFIYTLITILPTVLYLQSFWAHTALISGMCVLSAWNGANYYFEVFSTRYIESLEKGTQRIALLRRSSQAFQDKASSKEE